MSKRLFIFGLGYTALRFARAMQAEGWPIAGTVRNAAKAGTMRE
ncbi:MAG: SDR family NAD(P)-dependent oxidoreductase, partial [Alphaproteobacteria bacterium]